MPDELKQSLPSRLKPALVRPLRGRLARYVLPGVLVGSMAAGIGLGSLATPSSEALDAVPAVAPVVEAERAPERPSRDDPRIEIAPEAEAEALPAPAPVAVADVTNFTAVAVKAVGQREATENLNVRDAADDKADKIASIAKGDSVSITATTRGGWQQVVIKERTGWVLSKYLTKPGTRKDPAPAAAAKSAAPAKPAAPAAQPAAINAKRSCAPLPGLSANAEKVHQASCARFPGVSSYGGMRGGGGYHSSGQAVDIMISNVGYGQQIADYMRANAASLGVTEVIFNQRIWTTQRASEGWRAMSNRGSATANHVDHVHVSVR